MVAALVNVWISVGPLQGDAARGHHLVTGAHGRRPWGPPDHVRRTVLAELSMANPDLSVVQRGAAMPLDCRQEALRRRDPSS